MSVNIPVRKIMQNGYARQKQDLGEGWEYDGHLSSRNNHFYTKKDEQGNRYVVHNIVGTRVGTKDMLTDVAGFMGGLKSTNRYKESRDAINAAQRKYGGDATYVGMGHSLGGGLANNLQGKYDKIISHNKATFLTNKPTEKESVQRSRYDVASAYEALRGRAAKTTTGRNSSIRPLQAHSTDTAVEYERVAAAKAVPTPTVTSMNFDSITGSS